jgi:Neuraminidase (sialidase)
MFVYTHFTGGAGDHSKAHLAARYSSDAGKTWTTSDKVALRNEGDWNIMSVSLLRLGDGSIALFYMRKNSLQDCRPLLRRSIDEGKTWSKPTEIIKAPVGYYVMNNDRVVQLKKSGRLIAPVALHNLPGDTKPDWAGIIMCYLSDDNGQSWRRSKTTMKTHDKAGKRVMTQEPGVVELKDGRLMMFCRTDGGSQFVSSSRDGGDTWSLLRASNMISPRSPATIERIPSTGDLLLAWNDHSDITPELRSYRTPFTVAISRDDGITWSTAKTLQDDPHGWYCYTAMAFIDGRVLLGHTAGDRRKGHLGTVQITTFPVKWLYKPTDQGNAD